MEQRFAETWAAARQAAAALGVKLRPMEQRDLLNQAHRCLSGHRESDGFGHLAKLGKLELSLEAICVKKQFTGLFSDEEANTALNRLLEAGYY